MFDILRNVGILTSRIQVTGFCRFLTRLARKMQHFYYSARNCIANAVLATAIPSVYPSVRLSIRLSVCPSLTLRYCVKTTVHSTVQFALSDSKMSLVY